MWLCVLLVLSIIAPCRADTLPSVSVVCLDADCGGARMEGTPAVEDSLPRVPRRDPWLARDKFLHCTVSAGVAGVGYLSFRHLADLDEARSRWAASLTVLGMGLLKETRDRRRPNSWFSLRDLVADLVGIGVGLLIVGITYH